MLGERHTFFHLRYNVYHTFTLPVVYMHERGWNSDLITIKFEFNPFSQHFLLFFICVPILSIHAYIHSILCRNCTNRYLYSYKAYQNTNDSASIWHFCCQPVRASSHPSPRLTPPSLAFHLQTWCPGFDILTDQTFQFIVWPIPGLKGELNVKLKNSIEDQGKPNN